MWLNHIRFVIALILAVLMFIPAMLLHWLVGEDEPLFESFADVKECYDLIKSHIYTK